MIARALFVAVAMLTLALPATTQQVPDTTVRSTPNPLIRVGKWLTLGLAAGAATYGVVANRDADHRYEDLERICEADPGRCGPRDVSGQYTDPALESEYQDIVRLDDRAKLSLIAAQAALLGSVVLFVLDLPRHGGAEDIPYKPPRIQVGVTPDSRLELRYRIR